MNKVSPCSIRTLLKASTELVFSKSVHCHSTYTYCHGATSRYQSTPAHPDVPAYPPVLRQHGASKLWSFYSPVASCCPIVSYYRRRFGLGAVLDVSAVDFVEAPAVGFCPVGLTCATRHTPNRHRKPIRSHLCLSCCLFFLFFSAYKVKARLYQLHS